MEYYQPTESVETVGAIPPHETIHSKLGTKATLQLVPRGVTVPPTEGQAAMMMETDDDFGLDTHFVNPPLLVF
jgi:hypothetical protein